MMWLARFMSMVLRISLGALVIVSATDCAGSHGSKADKLEYMANLETETLADLTKQNPEAEKELSDAVGYAIIEQKVVKVPGVGAGGGVGVVVDKETDKRSFLRVQRVDLGAGVGGKAYKLVLVFHDAELLRDVANGKLHTEAGAEAAAKAGGVGGGAEGASGQLLKKGYSTYVLTDAGVSATATVRVFHAGRWNLN